MIGQRIEHVYSHALSVYAHSLPNKCRLEKASVVFARHVSHSPADNTVAAAFMSRINLMFEIIQELRLARRPLTGKELASRLEISLRSVYRYCASLQAMGVPIIGEAGVGYVLRRTYDLPPLAFTPDENDAILVGLRMIGRLGDPSLTRSAQQAMQKMMVAAALSERPHDVRAIVSQAGAPTISKELSELIRRAVHGDTILSIAYCDRSGETTRRRIWPLCLIYYPDATVIAAWCELRRDFRHFRADWIQHAASTDETFELHGAELRQTWKQRESWVAEYPGAVGLILGRK
ncbi:putative DNA-binding transcriptional regulator YafY [Rhizobium sp. SLBN-94]|nr:putative DNA-binding transcriptional regulator YafY [Rhizobium sp. SLBN-94]